MDAGGTRDVDDVETQVCSSHASASLEDEVAPAEHLEAGELVGRYSVVERIGSGGMGVVYRAHDPKLDRDVALKVLHRRPRTRDSDTAADARLLREAQVMARLTHPNVVPVYDVGRVGTELFVAMELVDGETLGAWLRARRRPHDVVIRVFIAAARGLAAAHRAGLVHRDFKPGNVMVSPAGTAVPQRVRVMDFGLARPVGVDSLAPVVGAAKRTGSGEDTDSLTEYGTVVGTPAYMSPEQHAGDEVGVGSDQFSLCVALYEALFGVRPFPQRKPEELARAKEYGPAKPPAGHGVPPSVVAVVMRGMEPMTDDRFPSIDALVDALQRRAGARRWTAAVGVGAVAVLGAWAASSASHAAELAACHDTPDDLADLWNPDARAQAERAVLETGVIYAQTAWARTETRLDGFAERWATQRRQACTGADEMLADRQRRCLDARRDELDAALAVLYDTTPATLDGSVRAVANLRDPQRCGDEAFLDTQLDPALDDATAREVAALQRELARAIAQADAGRHAAAIARLESMLTRARALGHEPLVAEIEFHRGNSVRLDGDAQGAARILEEAHALATSAGHDTIAIKAAAFLVLVHSSSLNDRDATDRWTRAAEAALDRGGHSQRLAATLHYVKAVSLRHFGELDAGFEHAREALKLRQQVLGHDHPVTAASYNIVAESLDDLSRHEDAIAEYERALAGTLQNWGNLHPDVASLHNNIAISKYRMGDYDEALAQMRNALALRRKVLPPAHPDLVAAMGNVGAILETQGEHEEALALLQEVHEITERTLGAEHPRTANQAMNVGQVLRRLDRLKEAERVMRRAVESLELAVGSEHPDLAPALSNLGQVLMDRERVAEAGRMHERAVAVASKAYGADNPMTATFTVPLAEAQLEQGNAAAAKTTLGPALAVLEASEVDPGLLAAGRFVMARAMVADGDRDGGIALAMEARRVLDAGGGRDERNLAQLDEWLAGLDSAG